TALSKGLTNRDTLVRAKANIAPRLEQFVVKLADELLHIRRAESGRFNEIAESIFERLDRQAQIAGSIRAAIALNSFIHRFSFRAARGLVSARSGARYHQHCTIAKRRCADLICGAKSQFFC